MSGDDSSRGKPLWAPWRIEYVEGYKEGEPPDPGCIFCDAPDAKPDRERLILHRGRHTVVRLNRYPYAAGHLMVSPFAHRARLADLEPAARDELVMRLAQCERILERELRCDGLNVGANLGAAAGAGFAEHLHFHVVPRWRGDVNFMTSIGEIRVIPAHIERSYERLLFAFREVDPR